MAGLFRRLDHAGLQRFKPALRVLGRRGIGRKPTNVDGRGSKLLADLIVQLARYSSALFFLSRQETGRQSLNFLSTDSPSLLQLPPLGDIAHKSDGELARGCFDAA